MLKTIDLAIDPDDISHEYDRAALGDLSDGELFDVACGVVARPREAPANSFVLHAPLELMARYLLLPMVPASARRAARERMLWVAAKYHAVPQALDEPEPGSFQSVDDARAAIVDAIALRDLVGVDQAATWLAEHASTDEVLTLVEPTVALLAAAGHAPIAFYLLSRAATTTRSALALLRPLVRELARSPELRVGWIDAAEWRSGTESAFTARLARSPRLGLPGNDFIFPLVHQIDASDIARDAIAANMPDDVTRAARASLRIAAHSMLQDDPAFAPYGWTHCLTIPHGIFETVSRVSNARRAAAIAATYVVAFRAGESSADLDLAWEPEPTSVGLTAALHGDPCTAAAAWYHAPTEHIADALPTLVARACTHEDAHFAKYTLACLAAAVRDPGARRLYLAAAASLAAWWATTGMDTRGFDDDQ